VSEVLTNLGITPVCKGLFFHCRHDGKQAFLFLWRLKNTIEECVPQSSRASGNRFLLRGISHDNGKIAMVRVNGKSATLNHATEGVTDWVIVLDMSATGTFVAQGIDDAANAEKTPHEIRFAPKVNAVSSLSIR
jgi:hypothetical protein